MADTKQHNMHVAWAVWWYTWIFLTIICMGIDPILPPWIWYVVFGTFFITELVGAIIKNRYGDTLSESIWTFAQAGVARRYFASIFGVALAFRGWTLFDITANYAGVDYDLWQQLPWTILFVGIALWLVLHYFYLGKKGVV